MPTLETTVLENGKLLKSLIRWNQRAMKILIWPYRLNGLARVKLALGELGKFLSSQRLNKGNN